MNIYQTMFSMLSSNWGWAIVVIFLCQGALYVYRLATVVQCMRSRLAEFATPIDRLIWVGLAVFLPFGIGAYLFHLVIRRQVVSLPFFIPLGTLILCGGYLLLKMPEMGMRLIYDLLAALQ